MTIPDSYKKDNGSTFVKISNTSEMTTNSLNFEPFWRPLIKHYEQMTKD